MNKCIEDYQNDSHIEIKQIVEILHIKPQNRSINDVHKLIDFTKSLNYFKKISKINYPSLLKACKVLSHIKKSKGQIIYLPGDIPNYFYVLLEGSVTVFFPKSKEILEKEEEKISYSEIESASSPISNKKFQKITSKTITILNLFQTKPTKNLDFTNNEQPSFSTRNLSNDSKMNKLSIREHKINEYLTFADLEDCEIFFDKARFKYQVSKILKVGMAFGELSSKIKQRNEAIVCNEDCELAIMVKNDYRDILMEIERIKKNNDLKFLTSTFLKDAPFMSKNSLLSLRCIFEKKKLKGGTSIYEIGENPQECFLMKKGEVEFNFNFIARFNIFYKLSSQITNQNLIKREIISNHTNNLMKTRKQAQNIKICLLGIGAFFGEYEILNQIPRVFSAKCYSSKVSLFYISRRKLFSYLHDNYHLQDFLMKQATQTHLWHLNQLQKINYDQNFIKISDNLIKGKAIKQFYKYRPIRSSVADLEEVINKDSSLRNLTAKNNNQNDENIKNKIEITFYEQKFFRGKRAVSNNTQNNNNNKNETKSIKIVNKVKVEEKGNNEDWNDIKSNIKKMNLGSKIVDVVSNNEKALKILKKQKDFSSLGLFFKFFETDKTKENLIRTDKKKRPMSAPFFSKDEANVTKNDSKLQFKRSFPSKPLDHNKSNSKEFVNYHLRRKSQQISNNTTLFVKQKMLTAGIHKRRQSSGNMFSQPKIPSDFKGILNIHSFQRH